MWPCPGCGAAMVRVDMTRLTCPECGLDRILPTPPPERLPWEPEE